MAKQLIILAGGKGSRLKDRLHHIPKPLIDICGKPLLVRQIELAKQNGFFDIVITVHHQADIIKNYFEEGKKWGVAIRYLEEKEPLGTAGAILLNLASLADTFFVMYGDTMLNVDLLRMEAEHHHKKAEITLFLHPNDHPHDSDLVEINSDNRVTAFLPYPHAENRYYQNVVNAGLYCIEKKSLFPFQQHSMPLDFGKNLFPAMLEKNHFILGYRSTEYIKDIGTPERLDKVCGDFISGKIERGSLKTASPAIFLDRDGTLNQEIGHLHSPDQLQLMDDAPFAIKQFNQAGFYSIVISNQPVIARGECDEKNLKIIHNKLETLLGKEGAYLDAIYYCPHHPDKGFPGERSELKIKCHCRKPGIALLQTAQQQWNIDLSQSWFIGDSTTDMKTAKNAGIKSILIRTGFRGEDDKYAARPDFEFFNLRDASQFILNTFHPMLAQARTLVNQIQAGEKIALGGLARSGKSTWATLIYYALAEKNIPCVIVNLDGWIKNSEDRNNENVLGRYDIDGINQLVDAISNQSTLSLPSYNRSLQSRHNQRETVALSSQQVILFEGVVALLIEKITHAASHLFYVDCDEKNRKTIFTKEYQLRNYSEKEIENLYQSRERDETPMIQSSALSSSVFHITGCLYDYQ